MSWFCWLDTHCGRQWSGPISVATPRGYVAETAVAQGMDYSTAGETATLGGPNRPVTSLYVSMDLHAPRNRIEDCGNRVMPRQIRGAPIH